MTAIPCKRPKVTAVRQDGGLYLHECQVPGCGWTFLSVKSAEDALWHKSNHFRAVPAITYNRGARGFVAVCECGWASYDGAETSRSSVDQTTTYHLTKVHGLVSC